MVSSFSSGSVKLTISKSLIALLFSLIYLPFIVVTTAVMAVTASAEVTTPAAVTAPAAATASAGTTASTAATASAGTTASAAATASAGTTASAAATASAGTTASTASAPAPEATTASSGISAAPSTPTVSTASVELYSTYRYDFSLPREYINPFNSAEVKVDVVYSKPGSGSENPLRVPCFWNGDRWEYRLSPDVIGRWEWHIEVEDTAGKWQPKEANGIIHAVEVKQQTQISSGFVTLARADKYFKTTTGQHYIPIGSNVSWGKLEEYNVWLRKMAANGANFARVWFSFMGGFGLEGPVEWDYPGLGRYHLDNAENIDDIVALAEAKGIRILFTMGNYRELIEEDYWGQAGWDLNPYNSDNGGPLEKPADMWTNAAAKRLYKDRLRYIAARWGYSPSIMAWEFWNEVDAPASWVGEMASYMKAVDSNRHLVSTTYGSDEVWALTDIDFTMTHIYRQGDISDMSHIYIDDARMASRYGKPHLLAEFGLDWKASDAQYDPDGKAKNFRQGLWASFLAGSAGSGMLWWWDNYISPLDLYDVFAPFARFIRGLDWSSVSGNADLEVKIDSDTLFDLRLVPTGGWGEYAQRSFTVARNAPSDVSGLPAFIYSSGKAPWNKPVDLVVDCMKPAEMCIGIGEVSSDTKLDVFIDGKRAWSKTFKPRAGDGEWEKSEYKPEWKIWQATWNKDYSIPIREGQHTISIRCPSGDWLSLRHITLKGYTTVPPVTTTGLVGDGFCAFWVHDAGLSSVFTKPSELPPLSLTIGNLRDGSYQVSWWNTATGAVMPTYRVTATGGKAILTMPALVDDMACRLTQSTP